MKRQTKLDPEELDELFCFYEFGRFVNQFDRRIPNGSKAGPDELLGEALREFVKSRIDTYTS